jgi:calcineurin-like phosphoesterase family protein
MKITLQKGQQLFFTSDTHFNHTNICQGVSKWADERTCRPFQSLEQMNKQLVDNINSVVGEDDILFHLGDWSFGGKEQIWEFRKQIRCKNIHLILGNHDHHITGDKIIPNAHCRDVIVDGPNPNTYGDERDRLFDSTFKELFSSVSNYKTLTVSVPQGNFEGKQLKNAKFRFVLCHFPIASWHDMNQGVMHLHGHIHTPHEHKVGPGKMMDVGIDGNLGFRPYEFNEVIQILKDQPIKGLLAHDFDHHGE